MRDDDIIATSNSKRSLYENREPIYVRMIKGKSHIYRVIVATLIYGSFFLLPWITWGDRPAIYFNLDARQFHIFSMNFWPQDFMYLAWMLIIAAFALFFFTAIAGRLWCGFACPQTIWTMVFMWVEEKIEGSPNQRKKLDKAPLSKGKVFKKLSKHAIWIVLAFITAAGFVSYFYPARELWAGIFSGQLSWMVILWLAIFSWLTYIDAAWLREQVCIYMCPYARFQGVMYDQDTLMVTYDYNKGEPRGSIKDKDKGQCIDCYMCVQVCPTGIDIRDGAQLACINCALCVDACNDVMASIGRPQDLILFTTQNVVENNKKVKLLRPRTFGYAAVMLIMIAVLVVNLSTRSPIEASVVRDRDHIYRYIGTEAANDYWLKVANKSQQRESYTVSIKEAGYHLHKTPAIRLESGEADEYQVIITTELQLQGSKDLTLQITNAEGNVSTRINTRFIFPPTR